MAEYKMSNSRWQPRLKVSYLMKYFSIDASGHEIIRTANTKDISPGGLRFITSEPPEKGAMLRFEVLVPASNHPVRAFGKVLRVEPVLEGKAFSVAVGFAEISREDSAVLTDLIERVLMTREAAQLMDVPEGPVTRTKKDTP
jgi:hypothetical protein